MDRASQFESGAAPAMLMQVRALWDANPDLDEAYLARRLDEETGGRMSLSGLRKLAAKRSDR